jgi:hypothetical protein
MSDLFIEYHATKSGTDNVCRVFVKVTTSKIAEHRRIKGDKVSNDIEVARELSQSLALTLPYLLQLQEYSLEVYCSDALPEELQNVHPTYERDGLTFWEA